MLLPPGPTPRAGASVLGPSLPRSGAFREPRLPVGTDPPAEHQPLTEAPSRGLPAIVCVTQTLLCAVGTLPSMQQQGSPLHGSDVGVLTREVLHMCGTISLEHPWEVTPDPCFYRDPGEIAKAAAEESDRGGISGRRMAPAPGFTAAQPEVAGCSESTGALEPVQPFPMKDWRALLPPRTGLQPPRLGTLRG